MSSVILDAQRLEFYRLFLYTIIIVKSELNNNQSPNLGEAHGIDFALGVRRYLENGEQNNTLRPHQIEVFNDIGTFLEDEERRGYVQLPTGTGKTVIFVELSKALMEAQKPDGTKPKILVVTPKIDLVHQTMGRSKEKGYGKFAPELKVASFFSDSTEEDRRSMQAAEVVVTTYASLGIMSRREQVELKSPEEIDELVKEEIEGYVAHAGADFTRSGNYGHDFLIARLRQVDGLLHNPALKVAPTGETMLDMFDIYILDEAHHVLGQASNSVLEMIDDSKPVIGFTATPDANQKRKLVSRLPKQIHNLAFNEAVSMELLSPLVPIAVKTGVDLKRGDMFDSEGEYLDERMSHLARSASRNERVVNIAQSLAELGIGTLVSCLAGDEALHARVIAEQLRSRGVAAEAVYAGISPSQRQRMYREFEAGELDVLTFIEVLGEGWDSERAKAIVNARPTRSLIIAQQRLGRIERPGGIAFAVDILDDYDKFNPPIHASDLLEGEDVPLGEVYGVVNDQEREYVKSVIKKLGSVANLASVSPAHYSNFHATIAEYTPIQNGNLVTSEAGHFSIPSSIARWVSGLNDEILDKLWLNSGQQPDVREGVMGYTLRRVYNRSVSEQLVKAMPVSDIAKAIKDNEGNPWMSSQAVAGLFARDYPSVSAQTIDRILLEIGDAIDWRPVLHRKEGTQESLRVYKAYKMNKQSAGLIKDELVKYIEMLEAARKRHHGAFKNR